jgi:hypothetical protein
MIGQNDVMLPPGIIISAMDHDPFSHQPEYRYGPVQEDIFDHIFCPQIGKRQNEYNYTGCIYIKDRKNEHGQNLVCCILHKSKINDNIHFYFLEPHPIPC